MEKITGKLPSDLESKLKGSQPAIAAPIIVSSYRDLVEKIARISYLNKDHLLFFRGQGVDYKNRGGSSSFYPTIYGGARLLRVDIERRFEVLNSASTRLVDKFIELKIVGAEDVKKRKLIQWSILQHYEVCPTPLLDFTHSIHVACSFAFLNSPDSNPFFYVFGLPYTTNRISVNSEHDLVNIRLLSICPPEALRPHFQEGYLVGTDEVTSNYKDKQDLDFQSRLIAKFELENIETFWDIGMRQIPEGSLYPKSDRVAEICEEIKGNEFRPIQSKELGKFLLSYAALEQQILSKAKLIDSKATSPPHALRVICWKNNISNEVLRNFHDLRHLQKLITQYPNKFDASVLADARRDLNLVSDAITNNLY